MTDGVLPNILRIEHERDDTRSDFMPQSAAALEASGAPLGAGGRRTPTGDEGTGHKARPSRRHPPPHTHSIPNQTPPPPPPGGPIRSHESTFPPAAWPISMAR